MIKLFLCVVLITLVSCFPLTSNSLKKLNVNDSEKDVVKVLGKPFSKKAYYNKVYWVYYVHDDFFSIFFNFSRFPFVGFSPFLRTGDEYWVIMEDGRVVSFGSAKNFKGSIPRALTSNSAVVDLEAN